MTNRLLTILRVLAAALALLVAAASHADTIVLDGSTIPLRGCHVLAIRGGEVIFDDARGQRERRNLEQVRAIGFDGLPQLDQAEAALAETDLETALMRLLQALLASDGDLQRLWIHARLARVHDYRGEPVPAVRHAAAVWMLDQDPWWRHLAPRTAVEPPKVNHAAAIEAAVVLREADVLVREGTLARLIDEQLATINPLAAEARGAAPAASTISGFTETQIRAWGNENAGDSRPAAAAPAPAPQQPEQAQQPQQAPAVTRSAPPPAAPPPVAAPISSNDRDSPDAIDVLLDARRYAEALRVCERVARDPGQRSLGQFLYQYGRALDHVGRRRDAAVMFLRCGVHFPSSPAAPAALIEAATIHREVFGDDAAARRLLEEARTLAQSLERPEEAERAAQALADVP